MLRYVDRFFLSAIYSHRLQPFKGSQYTDSNGTQGYALIEYATLHEANEAIQNLDGSKLLEQTIHVDYAFVRPPPSNNKNKGGPRGGRGGRPRSRSRSRSRSPGADHERD